MTYKFAETNKQPNNQESVTFRSKPPLIFSFFAGAGFLDLGFETEGFETGFVNEVYKPFMDAYQYARSQMGIKKPELGFHNGDICELTAGKGKNWLSNFVKQVKNERLIGFIGGPPCPDFSVGGKNRGRDGKNGILSAYYTDLICQQKPHFFLFENVKGLWRTKRHREFFEELKKKLHKNGYVTTERLINAMEYGAPQDRERIILIGFRKEIVYKKGLPVVKHELTEGTFPWLDLVKYSRKEISAKPWPDSNNFKIDSGLDSPAGVPKELTIEFWFKKNKVTTHPNAAHYFQPRQALDRFMVIEEGDVSKKSFKRLHRWRYSPTAAYGNNEVHLHPYKARRLSAAEALAIQSLPQNFSLPSTMTLSDMFKAVGNGVPYIAAQSIAKTIKKFLGD